MAQKHTAGYQRWKLIKCWPPY